MTDNKSRNTSEIKDLEDATVSQEFDVLSDPKYICSSSAIITEALKSGCDVVQMPNGDVIIREQKVVTTRYGWDTKKNKLIKNHTKVESEHSIL